MNRKNSQIACPNCRSTFILPMNDNAIASPLVCQECGRSFLPHFYCPDESSPTRHVFVASTLYVDNAGKVYTFCPDHTFTTYALTADSRPRYRRSVFYPIGRFLDSLAFRIGLTIEAWRWRLASRR